MADSAAPPKASAAPAVAETEVAANNPLLSDAVFPLYDQVKAEHVVPGMRALLKQLHAEIDALEASVEPTWEGLVQPLEKLTDKHSRAWGVVTHLKGVKDSPELRAAVEEVQPENVALGLRLSQSKPLYQAYKALRDGAAYEKLSDAQKRVVELELRDFVLGGVSLEGEAKERYNAIQQELAQLSTKFSNNVLDATKAFKKLITDVKEVDGLPATALGLAAQQARSAGHEKATAESGPWLFTLDFPSYYPVMTHAKNRGLREEMYKAYIGRAAEGEMDNTPIIDKILSLRQEKSKILGFKNFSDLSMASKMATFDGAEALLEELRKNAYEPAKQDLADVKAHAAAAGFADELLWWDVAFWAERLREAKYDLKDEELRPYFALPAVLDGLFKVAKRLFDVDIVAADGDVPVWHPDVRFFKVMQGAQPRAYFYLDPYSRPAEKRGGAWMAEVVGRTKLLPAAAGNGPRLPVAHMVCNQSPPVDGQPSLMTFREVETLFHEFGHALQHMLTTVDEGLVAGIRGVDWDAVELPSQFMENWCYDKPTLYSFAKHYQTGEPLPTDMFERLKAAKTYRSATQMLRQIHFSQVDLELHSNYTPGAGESIFDRDIKVAARTQVMPTYPGDRFLCSFSHIFAGGYSAGYYSYKWAEVLSADAFGAFEEAGLDNDDAVVTTGRKFRDTVLSLGGSKPPAEVFKMFRGRDPSTEALLRHAGLTPAVAA